MDFSLLRNILYNWGGMLASIIYAFFMLPYVIKHLGQTNYGLWNLITSVVGYACILDFGIQSSVNRHVAKFKAINDIRSVNSVYSNAIAVYSIIALGAMVVGVIVALFMDNFFNIPKESVHLVVYISLIMVVFSAMELPLAVYGSMLYAYQRFDIINIVSTFALLLQSALLLTMLKYGSSLKIFCYVIIFVGICKYSIYFFYTHKTIRPLKFRFESISRDLLVQMMRFSGITFIAIIINNIIFKTDNIVIGIFLDPKAITMYSVGFMMTDYGAQIVGKMCNTLTPKFNELHSREEGQELNSLIISSTRFSTLLGIPIGVSALVLGKDFIHLWLGPEFGLAYNVMAIMMGARMCGFPTAPLYSMLYGIGSHHLTLYAGITEALLNLGLSVLLVKTMGITGVAWGTFIPMFIGNVLFVLLVFKKLQLNLGEWFKKSLVQPFLFSGIFYAIIYNLNNLYAEVSWGVLVTKAVGVIVIYAVLFLVMGLTRTERSQVLHALSAKLNLGYNR